MKNALILALVAFALTLSALGQTAKVKALSPEDAAKAKQLHEEADRAKKAMEAFDEHVKGAYAGEKDGWGGGIEYSEDWKFIVPKVGSTVVWPNGGGTFTLPLVPSCWPTAPMTTNPVYNSTNLCSSTFCFTN